MKSLIFSFIIFICIVLPYSVFALNNNSPEISSVEPKEISPGMAVRIHGYRLGANETEFVKVIFLQNSREYPIRFGSASWTAADLSQGTQYLEVYIPEQIIGGKCSLIIDYKGQRSSPFPIEVLSTYKPPKIFAIRPQIVNPHKYVNVEGIGFNTKDSAELVDSKGMVYKLNSGGNPSPDLVGFRLPKDFPEGQYTLRVIENRSGLNQASNSLTFRVKNGLVPLDISPEYTDSVAVGQWTEFVCWTFDPLKKSTKVELKLRQGSLEKTIFIKNLLVMTGQIPNFFTEGNFTLQNRVWKNKDVSEWSSPVVIKISVSPKESKIYSFSRLPEKAEALFWQDNKTLKISPILYHINARAKRPAEIGKSKLKIFSRVFKSGVWSNWRFENSIYNFDKEFYSGDELSVSSFDNYFYIGKDSPEFYPIERGEILRINGDFYEKSPKDFRLNLSKDGEIISLKPTNLLWELIFFKIPKNIGEGDWKVSLTNQKTKNTANIPVKLRIN